MRMIARSWTLAVFLPLCLLLSSMPALAQTDVSSATALPAIATAARTLATRFSDTINVRDYGAKCDGSTDDTAAFKQAISVATGAVANNSVFTSAQQTALTPYNNVGQNKNNASAIKVPAGSCILSSTLTATLLKNSALGLEGAGTGLSELVWTNSGDGLDINYAANSQGNDIAHVGNWQGQSVYIKGLSFVTAYAGANSGIAVNITGIQLINANSPPVSVIEDVTFHNRDGWSAATEAWGGGLKFTNPDNLFINRVEAVDYRAGRTLAFQIASTSSSGAIGHGEIVCDDCGAIGGSQFFDITGNGIQGVFLNHAYALSVSTGLTWLSSANALNGSLSITNSSMGASSAIFHAQHIGTIFSSGNYFYNTSPPTGQDWHAVWLDGVDWVNEVGDTIVGPAPGHQGSGYNAYGIVLNQGAASTSTYDGQPSIISNVSISGADYGFSAQGPNTTVQSGTCYTVTTCFQDTYTGNDSRFHPQFYNMTTADEVNYADAGHQTVMHGALVHMFGSSIELGLPGVSIPGTGTGSAGFLDWHSAASSNSSPGGLNDYDCRTYVAGGTTGTVGQGMLNLSCTGGFVTSGGIVDGSAAPVAASNGGTIKAVDNTAGSILVCSGTLSSLSLVMPPNPRPKQTFHIASECNITTLTISGGTSTTGTSSAAGTTAAGVTATMSGGPGSMTPSTPVTFVFDNDRSIWARW